MHEIEMTLADKLFEGAAISVMGFLIVFIVLIIIMAILSIFNLVNKAHKAKAAAPAAVETVPQPAAAPAPAAENLVDDKQLAAVITAAILAAEKAGGNEGTDGLVVRSIRRVNTWNKEALSEQANTL